ncbi:MAG TPA: CRTAC1 family protein [Chthonomonadaceae bacterium]|nr:CRTAC1 family protein [Chthonomonadaceae bacterium]
MSSPSHRICFLLRILKRASRLPAPLGLAALWIGLAGGLAGCHRSPSVTVPVVKAAEAASADPYARPAQAVQGIRFENVAEKAGLHYRWPQQPRPLRNLEAFGCGCAFLDYDNDGWQDILLVTAPHVLLYHNKGNGQFEEVSEAMGLAAVQGDWKGCAVGDYDGDGYLDLVLTGFRRLALLKNAGGKGFQDVTAAAGLDPHNRGHWGSSAGFMDLEGNGRLDLVLLNYVIFGPHEPQYCEMRSGVRSGCPPSSYRPEFGELWQNLGNGKFKDVTDASGMKATHGKALVVAFADVNGDGRMDFYIGNDGTPADLMLNLGGLRFRNVALRSNVAYGALAHPMAAMGADWADYDRDGRLDLAVSGFSDESYTLYRAVGRGFFEQTSDETGLSGPTYKPLGFGDKWIDLDNDGWPDLIFVNGHVYDNVHDIDPLSTFRQPMMLFHNERGRQFTDLVPQMGGEVATPILGRGLATGDFDNDGRMDFLAVDYEGQPLLFHNVSQTPNHWITLDLRGSSPNRFAYGAQVVARAGKDQWVGQVSPASSYLSSSDPRIHFGLGQTATLDSLTIRWPDGHQETLRHIAPDRILCIEEGRGIPHKSLPLPTRTYPGHE